jgi:hypothetical protein
MSKGAIYDITPSSKEVSGCVLVRATIVDDCLFDTTPGWLIRALAAGSVKPIDNSPITGWSVKTVRGTETATPGDYILYKDGQLSVLTGVWAEVFKQYQTQFKPPLEYPPSSRGVTIR